MLKIKINDLRDKIAQMAASAIRKSLDVEHEPLVETPKDPSHGDFSTACAMSLAKVLKKKPREIASEVVSALDDPEGILAEPPKVEGAGFINFRISDRTWRQVIADILEQGDNYGRTNIGGGEKVLIEFVSANPTGPLHIGHARGAAIGDSMARILLFSGYNVTKEFYINDAGLQVETLAKSVHARLLELNGIKVDWEKVFPNGDYYPGQYVRDIAKKIYESQKDKEALLAIPAGNYHEKESSIAVAMMLEDIKRDLKDFQVEFDVWFRESSLYKNGVFQETLELLQKQDDIYEKDGALWFKVSKYEPSEEDRVIRKSSGEWTYFASDITYHRDKLKRGFERLINIWGADHHGYIGRVKSALNALGFSPDRLQVLLVQMVNLLRNGQPVRMGKRTGEFVTLREVLDEVGTDAMRFTFLSRSSNSHLDFDIDALKMKPGEDSEVKINQLKEKNPVYYVQYAHARARSIIRKAQEAGINKGCPDLSLLVKPQEMELTKKMEMFPREVAQSAVDAEPHRLTHYLLDLAGEFHRYYYMGDRDKSYKVLSDDRALACARVNLVSAVAVVIKNGLELLGVSAPQKM